MLLDDEAISPDGRSIVRKMGSVMERSDKLPEGWKRLPKNPKRIDGMVAENVTNEYFLRATPGKGSFT